MNDFRSKNGHFGASRKDFGRRFLAQQDELELQVFKIAGTNLIRNFCGNELNIFGAKRRFCGNPATHFWREAPILREPAKHCRREAPILRDPAIHFRREAPILREPAKQPKWTFRGCLMLNVPKWTFRGVVDFEGVPKWTFRVTETRKRASGASETSASLSLFIPLPRSGAICIIYLLIYTHTNEEGQPMQRNRHSGGFVRGC